jgi:uncharacterized protein
VGNVICLILKRRFWDGNVDAFGEDSQEQGRGDVMGVRTDFSRAVVAVEDVGIVMPDGCRLSARVWMPDDAAADPVPAVLEYIPYRKRDGTLPRDEMMHPYVAGHGYACVRVDMRGNGDSDGLMTDEYTVQELQDACDVIAWLSVQPWCSGSVGMMGKSWGGFNCLQTAFLQPPALKAVVSVCSTTDRFADDIHFRGGCLLGENFGWGTLMLSYSSRPPDPALRADWRAFWLARLEAMPHLTPRWAGHQARDAYWRHGSIAEDYAAMRVPVLIVGGWADNYMNTVAEIVAHVPGSKGIVGPWVHQYPHTAVPGPQIGFLQECVRWWDRWLKGARNGVEEDPAMRAYLLHSARPDASAAQRAGEWIACDWPAPLALQVLPLSDQGLVAGALSTRICTPQHHGMDAGEFFPMGLNAEMPGDQAGDDALAVCFDGAVLAADLTLMGRAEVRLRLSADAPRGHLIARLCDVAPDGTSVRIAHGMLNLCHRDSMANPAHMVSGQVYDVTLPLDLMAYRMAAGHRLRLALATAYWPFVWPSASAVTLTLHSGSLQLPVVTGALGDWTPPPAETAKPWAHRVLRAGHKARRAERDLIAGTHALVVEDDGGDVENLDHGLVTGETMSERWQVRADDPLSAVATHTWEQRLSRGDWRVRTHVTATQTCTATHLRIVALLQAWEGDTLVFTRHFDDQVSREFI